MTNKHTPEPWFVKTERRTKRDYCSEQIWGNYSQPEHKRIEIGYAEGFSDEDKVRLVECVNFCKGFTNKQLKDMGSLKQQQSILVAFLREEGYEIDCVNELASITPPGEGE
jgi:hypothetical protein